MGRKLKVINVEDNIAMREKACEEYVCKSCGKKMVSANFVSGLCIQIFTTHGAECGYFTGNGLQRTTEVTCETCRYYDEVNGCNYEGEYNSRMESVRTKA